MADAPRSLRIDFESEEIFRREYSANIANGGIFIATNVGFDVREAVRVEVSLNWCGEHVELDGEIVHVVSAEMGGAGGQPGVAVQFTPKASEIRDCFSPFLGAVVADDERQAGTGRRSARRATARVPVVVCGLDGAEREGRSRDLSQSGVLVVLDSDGVEVGDRIVLSLSDPNKGEELELPGEVMRHVRSYEGAPLAVGIRFLIPAGMEEEAHAFIESIQVSEHSRRMGGITGPIAEIGIENLLQMFGTCAPKGTLTLIRADEEGFILIEGGMLRGAQLGESYGRKALSRLLEWREGSFEFQARTDESLYRGDPLPLDAAMLDALRLLDEGQEGVMDSLDPDAKLGIDPAALEEARAELGQAEEAIVDLASVGMTVSKVIDVIPEPDVEVRKSILALLARGLIRFDD